MPRKIPTRLETRHAPSFHPVYPRLLCTALRNRGLDPRVALESSGLTAARLDAAAGRLSLEEMRRLTRAARALCPDPVLALEWGALGREGVHGAASTAVLSSRTVGAALRMLPLVTALRTTAIVARVRETARQARLEFEQVQPLGEMRGFLLAALAVVNARVLESLLGAAGSRVTVELPLAPPARPEQWQRYFQGSLRFGAARLAYGIPHDLLERECPAADDFTHEAALRQCELEARGLHSTAAARIGAQLARLDGFPTLAGMARELGLSARSLSRALTAEGTSYRAIVESARREAAARLLADTGLSVQSIADRLGYADPSNFVRAFRRWHECTPQQYRERAESAPSRARRALPRPGPR